MLILDLFFGRLGVAFGSVRSAIESPEQTECLRSHEFRGANASLRLFGAFSFNPELYTLGC